MEAGIISLVNTTPLYFFRDFGNNISESEHTVWAEAEQIEAQARTIWVWGQGFRESNAKFEREINKLKDHTEEKSPMILVKLIQMFNLFDQKFMDSLLW